MKPYVILASTIALGAGCASPITTQDQQSLAQPINCATSEGDSRVLQSEKANVGKEIANGVSSIVPIGLVINTIDRTEKARFEVGTGEYNRMLDKKIAEIKAQCGK